MHPAVSRSNRSLSSARHLAALPNRSVVGLGQKSWRAQYRKPLISTTATEQNTSLAPTDSATKIDGPSTDLRVIYRRLIALALPYWTSPTAGGSARWKLAGVVGLTLATTGVSVLFNFMGRDFFNALSEKNVDAFYLQLGSYLGAFALGIPVYVFKSYFQNKLALEWRQWQTEQMLESYMNNRTFYQLQGGGSRGTNVVDNPDQRISSDVTMFTETALSLSLTLLNAMIDIVSFSGILYTIYPPLFVALILYSTGGTVGSIVLGKNLVGLNFNQEAREADLRYNLVRVRENAESIAFYRGEQDERRLLMQRLQAAVENYLGLLTASRNLDFFTSFYRYMIQLLPAAVVAPLFFAGKIEFGVVNQSQSAFNHVLNDLSLIVYQFENLAGFSAVIDRLGQFTEVMESQKAAGTLAAGTAAGAGATATASAGKQEEATSSSEAAPAVNGAATLASSSTASINGDISVEYITHASSSASSSSSRNTPLLTLSKVTVCTPDRSNVLVEDLSLTITAGQSLLIMGPSGAGKTSIMRAVAGLWRAGSGSVTIHVAEQDVMFLPQRPYMVLGSLRDQVLYPRFRSSVPGETEAAPPSDEQILEVLRTVRLGAVLARYRMPGCGSGETALDAVVDWAASLSLGEQQRLAWARLLLAKPSMALLDEATSALDAATEEALYEVLEESGITYISVGHRPSLREHHRQLLTVNPSGSYSSGEGSQSMWDGGAAKLSWELKPLVTAYRMM